MSDMNAQSDHTKLVKLDGTQRCEGEQSRMDQLDKRLGATGIITLQDVLTASTVNERQIATFQFLGPDGVSYTTRLKLTSAGLLCPTCGELCQEVRVHYRGRGLVCPCCAVGGRRVRGKRA